MNDDQATVFLVDDDVRVLTAMSRLLREMGYTVAPFNSPVQFLQEHDTARPGCAILDVAMPGLNGLDLQQALTANAYQRPIIFITGGSDIGTSVQAMKAGAVDYLTKPVEDDELLVAVEQAMAKDRVARAAAAETEEVRRRYDSLTPREQEVMTHVVAGQLNKQIAGDLGTVEKTVKVHRARVMAKMQVRSVADLVRAAEAVGVPISASKSRN